MRNKTKNNMNALQFFKSQLITDAASVIDKTKQKYSRNDLMKFAEAYHKFKLEIEERRLFIPPEDE